MAGESMLARFIQDETGATAIEYGLIAAMLATAVVGSVRLLGGEYESMYAEIKDVMVASTPR